MSMILVVELWVELDGAPLSGAGSNIVRWRTRNNSAWRS